MSKNLAVLSVILFVAIHTLPASAGDLAQPERFGMVDAWLTSNPQPEVEYHVFRACRDMEMSDDCTQCIYKAKGDGSVWIPSENRCIYRVADHGYTLYFQLKAVAMDGRESDWTEASPVYVTRSTANGSFYGSSWSWVRYDLSLVNTHNP